MTEIPVDLDRLESNLTSKRWQWIFRDPKGCPETLGSFLRSLTQFDKINWNEQFTWGGIFINGEPARENSKLSAPCRVEFFEPLFDIENAEQVFPEVTSKNVVFQDDYIVIAFKPAKLPSVPAREQRYFTLHSALEKLCGCKVHMPSRLDTSASGLVLASKHIDTHHVLQQDFEKRRVTKEYLLELAPQVSWKTMQVDAKIGRDERHPVLRRIDQSHGKTATTEFKKLCDSDLGSFVLAMPTTGRTHQLRVHAAHLGHPIVGDNFYNGVPAVELCLLATALSFHHPVSKEIVKVKLPDELMPAWAHQALLS